jgi:hypothetical protein
LTSEAQAARRIWARTRSTLLGMGLVGALAGWAFLVALIVGGSPLSIWVSADRNVPLDRVVDATSRNRGLRLYFGAERGGQ